MNFKGGKFSSACLLTMIDYKGQDYTFTHIYVPKSWTSTCIEEKEDKINCSYGTWHPMLSSEAGGEKTKPRRSLGLSSGIWTHIVVHQLKMGDFRNPHLGWWAIWTIGFACSTHAYHAYNYAPAGFVTVPSVNSQCTSTSHDTEMHRVACIEEIEWFAPPI